MFRGRGGYHRGGQRGQSVKYVLVENSNSNSQQQDSSSQSVVNLQPVAVIQTINQQAPATVPVNEAKSDDAQAVAQPKFEDRRNQRNNFREKKTSFNKNQSKPKFQEKFPQNEEKEQKREEKNDIEPKIEKKPDEKQEQPKNEEKFNPHQKNQGPGNLKQFDRNQQRRNQPRNAPSSAQFVQKQTKPDIVEQQQTNPQEKPQVNLHFNQKTQQWEESIYSEPKKEQVKEFEQQNEPNQTQQYQKHQRQPRFQKQPKQQESAQPQPFAKKQKQEYHDPKHQNQKDTRKSFNRDQSFQSGVARTYYNDESNTEGGAFSRSKKKYHVNDNDDKSDTLSTTSSSTEPENFSSLQSKLEYQLSKETCECTICLDRVKKHEPIWSCGKCSTVFHLNCVQDWIVSIYQNQPLFEESDENAENSEESIVQPQQSTALQWAESLMHSDQINVTASLFGPQNFENPTSSEQNNNNRNRRNNQFLRNSNKKNELDNSSHANIIKILSGKKTVIWYCPMCRERLPKFPKDSICFCGKKKEPEKDKSPYLPTYGHSCGSMCGKERIGTPCPHKCNCKCHPGPCPPCNLARKETCFCSKTTFFVPCSTPTTESKKSCGNICGKKLLGCGCTCEKKCHDGECDNNCGRKTEQFCYCGKKKELRICANGEIRSDAEKPTLHTYSCGETCGRMFNCGKHKCEKMCHAGQCSPRTISDNPQQMINLCPFDPSVIIKCPCGKCEIKDLLGGHPRKDCTDPIPCCKNKCGKLLPCGTHNCEKPCHHGPCGHCMKMVEVSCRCGSSRVKLPHLLTYYNTPEHLATNLTKIEKEESDSLFLTQIFKYFPNYEFPAQKKDQTVGQKEESETSKPFVYLCNTPCKTKLSCGRHTCPQVCCPAKSQRFNMFHQCPKTCSKKLNCNKHKCSLPCHVGPCPSCNELIDTPLVCRCGKTRVDPPYICGTRQLPPCLHPCVIPRTCGHPSDHNCHELNEYSCPPCFVDVDKQCSCGKHMVKVPCHQENVSCGNICGKLLNCGVHHCRKICHQGECIPKEQYVETESVKALKAKILTSEQPKKTDNINTLLKIGKQSSTQAPAQKPSPHTEDDEIKKDSCCVQCPQKCAIRIKSCGHKCLRNCHAPVPCDSLKCLHKVQVSCSCGRLKKEKECWEVKEKVDTIIGKQKQEIEKLLAQQCFEDDENSAFKVEKTIKRTYMNCFLFRTPILYQEGEENDLAIEQPQKPKKISLFIQENKPMFAKLYANNPNNPYDYSKIKGKPTKRKAIDFKIKINDYYAPPRSIASIVISYDPKNLPPILDCDAECHRIQRNMRLAQALNINVEKYELPVYSKELMKFGKKNLDFVEWVQETFSNFISSPSDNYYFTKKLNPEKRKFIHEYGTFYQLSSIAVDWGESRSIILHKSANSTAPKFRLSEIVNNSQKTKLWEEKCKEKEEDAERDVQKEKKRKEEDKELKRILKISSAAIDNEWNLIENNDEEARVPESKKLSFDTKGMNEKFLQEEYKRSLMNNGQKSKEEEEKSKKKKVANMFELLETEE